jgi:hypothetical protein
LLWGHDQVREPWRWHRGRGRETVVVSALVVSVLLELIWCRFVSELIVPSCYNYATLLIKQHVWIWMFTHVILTYVWLVECSCIATDHFLK